MNVVLRHPAADPRCQRCMGIGLRVVPEGPIATAVQCSCVDTCPTCRGTGWISEKKDGRSQSKRCDCYKIEALGRRFDEVRIPARYANATLASFKPRKETTLAFVAANRYVQEYVKGEPNPGLVLHGLVGRGKTHLMVGVLRELVLRYRITARFVEFSHLLGDLKASFSRGGTSEILDPLSKVEVLAIDELGKGRNTEFEGTVLDELVSRRYNAHATILATTNYAPGAATGTATPSLALAGSGHTTPSLADRVGERVYSRLRESSRFVEVKGEDYREVARKPGPRR